MKYHISPTTGRPNLCRAQKACPFGGESEHYASKEEARAAYEEEQKNNLLPSPALKKESWPGASKGAPNPLTGEYSTEGKKFLLQEKGEAWFEQPLTPAEEKEREELTSKVHTLKQDSYEKLKRLNTRLRYGGTETKPASHPPVPTDYELNQWEANLQDQLYGYSLKSLIETRDVRPYMVEDAERRGDYNLTLKVPSYYEVGVPTDLLRKHLAMPPRIKTKADRTPLRQAELALSEFEEGYYGKIIPHEEAKEKDKQRRTLESTVRKLRDEVRIKKARDSFKLESENSSGAIVVKNNRGRDIATLRQEGSQWTVEGYKTSVLPSGMLGKEPMSLGTFSDREEALMHVASLHQHSG